MIDHATRLIEAGGYRWWVPTEPAGDKTIAAMERGGVLDQEIVDEALQHIRPGSDVLELGANFGQMTVRFARAAAPGRVHAFEAEPFVAQLLDRNIRANGAWNARCWPAAAWHTSGLQLSFPPPDFVHMSDWGCYGIEPGLNSGRMVSSLAIDDLPSLHPISLMKIDVQGADLYAMRGARATIARHRMPIIFEYEAQFQEKFNTSFADYERFIDEIGYSITKTINICNYLIESRK